MKGDQDMEILEALIELKNQIQDMRRALTDVELEDKKPEESYPDVTEEFKMELTPQEMSALLYSPFNEKTDKPTPGEYAQNADEIAELRSDFIKLREQTETEITDIKRSVAVLSEMWGQHELEFRKFKKYR